MGHQSPAQPFTTLQYFKIPFRKKSFLKITLLAPPDHHEVHRPLKSPHQCQCSCKMDSGQPSHLTWSPTGNERFTLDSYSPSQPEIPKSKPNGGKRRAVCPPTPITALRNPPSSPCLLLDVTELAHCSGIPISGTGSWKQCQKSHPQNPTLE